MPGVRDDSPTSPWSSYNKPSSGYTYSSNSQLATPYLLDIQPTHSIFDPAPPGRLLTQEDLREIQPSQATSSEANHGSLHNPVWGYGNPVQGYGVHSSVDTYQKPYVQDSMLPRLDSASILSGAAAKVPTAFMSSSIFDQPYTNPGRSDVQTTNYHIKTTTKDKQSKSRPSSPTGNLQSNANYDQLKRYLDSTQPQSVTVIESGPTPKMFETHNPFRQIQSHYAIKEQRDQQYQQQGKGKGKGKNYRQKQIAERTQGYQELHNLIETKRVSHTPTAHTTKYERSSCRVGDISGFIESQHVLETITAKKDFETAQRMKEQLEQIGQLEQQTKRTLAAANQPIELPKLHNCDEHTCPQCFEDFLGRRSATSKMQTHFPYNMLYATT